MTPALHAVTTGERSATPRMCSIGSLCRVDRVVVRAIAGDKSVRVALCASLCILAGASSYGFVYGIWHSWTQAWYACIKMPLLIFAVVLTSAAINGMLAQVLRSGLSFRQVLTSILVGLAIACLLLGSVSPAILYLVSQFSAGGDGGSMLAYRCLLVGHTSIIGIAGVLGNVRLYGLLCELTGSRGIAARVLVVWIAVTGFVGTQLSWMMSPFLARPDVPLPFLNPNAFNCNFFEYLLLTIRNAL